MGYQVKWVEENLGITRKALRIYEEKGLIPKNIDGQYRNYSEEDLDRIWNIKVLNGMGFTLNEIVSMAEDPDLDLLDVLNPKIKQLEKSKEKLELHLGYAKMIRTTGRFPHRPTTMGATKFEDFQEHALNEWNINSEPSLALCSEMLDISLRPPEKVAADSRLDKILSLFDSLDLSDFNLDIIYAQKTLPRQLAKRASLGAAHPEVQLIVKMIYDFYVELIKSSRFTKALFSRYYASTYLTGDMALLNERELGEKACKFIAEATAVFGGYTGLDDPNFF